MEGTGRRIRMLQGWNAFSDLFKGALDNRVLKTTKEKSKKQRELS